MEFTAYSVELVEQGENKVASLCCWGDKLLAGLNDGKLLVYSKVPSQNEKELEKWSVSSILKSFGKKSIVQLQLITSTPKPLLLSLDEEGVNLCTLPDFRLKCQALNTKYAVAFSWLDDKKLLAVGSRRRVTCFGLVGHDLVGANKYDCSFPDAVVCLLWSTDFLLVGLKTQYFVKFSSGALFEVDKVGSAPGPCMAQCPGGEVAYVKDTTIYFLNEQGQVSRNLAWGRPPRILVCAKNYAVSVQDLAMEIRSWRRLGSESAIQIVTLVEPISAMTSAPSPDGSLFVSHQLSAGILRLVATPLADQARQLAAMHQYTEALILVEMLKEEVKTVKEEEVPDTTQSEVQDLEDWLRIQYAHDLFAKGTTDLRNYDCAWSQLTLTSTGPAIPLLMLRMLPSLVPTALKPLLPNQLRGQALPEVVVVQGEEFTRAVQTLMPYLLSYRTKASFGGNEELQSPRLPASAPLSPGSDAPALSPGELDTPSTSAPSIVAHTQPPILASCTSLGVSMDPAMLSMLLDTCSLAAALALPEDHFVARKLVKEATALDLAAAENMLLDAGRYADLVELYQHHHRYVEGLRLLEKLCQHPEQLTVPPSGAAKDLIGLPAVYAAARLIVEMSEEDTEVIQKHLPWILRADPEHGIQALMQRSPPLAPVLVLSVLRDLSPDVCALYLEAAIKAGIATAKEYHSELLLLYLKIVLDKPHHHQHHHHHHHRLHQTTTPERHPTPPLPDAPASPERAESTPGPQHVDADVGNGSLRANGEEGDAAVSSGASCTSQRSSTGGGEGEVPDLHELLTNRPAHLLQDVAVPSGRSFTSQRPTSLLVSGSRAVGRQDSLYVPLSSQGVILNDALTSKLSGALPALPSTSVPPYEKLKELVFSSPYIDPEYVLSRLPKDSLHEIRVLMLERLGRHNEAVQLYVNVLHSIRRAEEYCDRVYDSEMAAAKRGVGGAPRHRSRPRRDSLPAQGGHKPSPLLGAAGGTASTSSVNGTGQDIYMMLIQAVLAACPHPDPGFGDGGDLLSESEVDTWHQLAWVVSRKRDRIDPLQVLPLIPDNLPLADVMPFFEGVMRWSVEQKRNLAVVRNLRRAENLQAREDIVRMKSQEVIVSAERACVLCHKRLGVAVVVAYPPYPHPSLAHYRCHKLKGQANTAAATPNVSPAVGSS